MALIFNKGYFNPFKPTQKKKMQSHGKLLLVPEEPGKVCNIAKGITGMGSWEMQ